MGQLSDNDRWVSPEEYLQMELKSLVRHEYFSGDIYAMAGASVEHNLICGDIFTALNVHLRGKKCVAFMNDMKVHVQRGREQWFYYPDVLVNCDPAGQQTYYCDTPAIIFEVLSPNTGLTDAREKRLAYEMIPALHTYILVAQDRRLVTVHRREVDGWSTEVYPRDGSFISLPEIDFALGLDEISSRAPF